MLGNMIRCLRSARSDEVVRRRCPQLTLAEAEHSDFPTEADKNLWWRYWIDKRGELY